MSRLKITNGPAQSKRVRACPLRRNRQPGRPRLSVFRSSKHIYAQVIDDPQGRGTLASASSLEKADARNRQNPAPTSTRQKASAQLAWRNVLSRTASPKWCSIAAAISITAASRRLGGLPRARAD